MNLREAKAVVTGGASGLGAAVANRLARAGAQVVVLDRSPVVDAATSVRGMIVDITDEQAVHSAIEQAAEQMGGITFAINCAGIAIGERAVGREGPMRQARFRHVIDVNLIGTFTVCTAAAAIMQRNAVDNESGRGVIVNTASIAAFDGQIGLAAYAASKGGVVSMTLPLAREFAAFGVRVVCIAPGVFGTPMSAGLPPAVIDTLTQQTPFPRRLGDPDEFAKLVCHVYENDMLNGVTIRLDGALRMQ